MCLKAEAVWYRILIPAVLCNGPTACIHATSHCTKAEKHSSR